MNEKEQDKKNNQFLIQKTPKHLLPNFPPSLVPKYEFSSTLREQKEQLKVNPLIKRFTKSRKRLAGNKYRPFYHFVSPEGTMNDPNGLCFWQGKWHLFYQASLPEDGRIHWGHIVSDDLIRWRDLPYAIYPSPEESCYSGSTLVENGRVIAMYHGTRIGSMVATSSDPLLLNWHKLTGKPAIPMAGSGDKEYDRWHSPDGSRLPYYVHDACIWKKEGIYYSLTGGRLPNGPGGKPIRANFLFRSRGLVDWEYLHPFVEGDCFTLIGDDGACPYFWPIGNRYILFFYSHMSGGQALLGDYDKKRDKFIVSEHYRFNYGASTPGGVHAPSAFPDGKGGIIVIFNMNPAIMSDLRAPHLGQIMTLPRRITLVDKNELKIEPVETAQSLRYNHQHLENIGIPANQEVVLEGVKGNSMEFIAEIDPLDTPMIEFNVLRSPNREEFTRITFFPKRGYRNRGHRKDGPPYGLVSIDSSYSSLDTDVKSRAPEIASVLLQEEESLKLHVFLDRSVLEVFINDKQCLAIRVYPSREDSTDISLRSQGRNARLISLDAWQMLEIYSKKY